MLFYFFRIIKVRAEVDVFHSLKVLSYSGNVHSHFILLMLTGFYKFFGTLSGLASTFG